MQEVYRELEARRRQIEEWERKWQTRWNKEGFTVEKSKDMENFKLIDLYNKKKEIRKSVCLDRGSLNVYEQESTKDKKFYERVIDSEGKVIIQKFEDEKGLEKAGFSCSEKTEIWLENAEKILKQNKYDIKKYWPELKREA